MSSPLLLSVGAVDMIRAGVVAVVVRSVDARKAIVWTSDVVRRDCPKDDRRCFDVEMNNLKIVMCGQC